MSVAIVAAPLANKPFAGGFAWVPLSFVRGLGRLGFDVYFVEQIHAGGCVDTVGRSIAFADSANRAYFESVMSEFALTSRSSLLYGDGAAGTGLPYGEVLAVASGAELLVNISGHLTLPALFSGPRLRVYVDMDPGYTQAWHASGRLPDGIWAHDAHFSIAENIAQPGCLITDDGIDWAPLLQPVVLEDWPATAAAAPAPFTTVSTWRTPSGVLTVDGQVYSSKLHEFRRLIEMPGLSASKFELAVDIHPADGADRSRLLENGWGVVDPRVVAGDPRSFQAYVAGSTAEFSAAQGVYSATSSGWFSDRSVRYLATGRPVLVQDTGFSRTLPEGEGIVAFSTLDEAVAGAARIVRDYPAHCQAARQIAETVFDSDTVLGGMVERVGARV